MCDHAGIEPELLHIVLYDGELLEPAEISGLARLYGCPVGVLKCPKVIMLEMGRRKHSAMAAEVCSLYIRLKHMAQDDKNADAEKYMGYAEWRLQGFLEAVKYDRLSYCHCLGAKERFLQYIRFATPQPKRRALSVK